MPPTLGASRILTLPYPILGKVGRALPTQGTTSGISSMESAGI